MSSTIRSSRLRTALGAAVLLTATAVTAVTLQSGNVAHASVPTTTPVFTTPTAITNTFFRIVPGAVKVFRGKSDGVNVTDVDIHTTVTRDFTFNGATVTCRQMQEYAFDDGELVEISYNYFAQADDGTVYYFGETVDNFANGQVADHHGSWLVGGPVGNDPPETQNVTAPAIFMPANPEVNDTWNPEDLPSGNKEIDTLYRVNRTVKTGVGKLTGCIEVREVGLPDNATETKWYAPGVGVIQAKAKRELVTLDSTTLR